MSNAYLIVIGLLGIADTLHSAPALLTIDSGGVFDVDYDVSSGGSTSAVIHVTGDLSADVGMRDGVVTKFRFSGGNVSYSNTTSTLTGPVFGVPSTVKLLTRGVVASARSSTGAGAIDPVSGVISNSGHRLVQDRGVITAQQFVFGAKIYEEVRNLVTNPDSTPMVGATTVKATLIAENGPVARYRIAFSHARDETREQDVVSPSVTLTIRENGGFTATGEVTVPSPDFTDWAEEARGQIPEDVTEKCEVNGQPLVLLYAFDAPEGPWQPPVTFDPVAGEAAIALPDGGLKVPVRLEFSPDLTAGSWELLPVAGGGESAFATGAHGAKSMTLPGDGKGFVRLVWSE